MNTDERLTRLEGWVQRYEAERRGKEIWRDFTASITALAPMTLGSIVSATRYSMVGNICYVQLVASFTTDGTASSTVYCTTPLPMLGTPTLACYVNTAGSGVAGFCYLVSSTSLAIRRYDSANWSLASDLYFRVTGFYEF